MLDVELGFQPSRAVAVRLNLTQDWTPADRAQRDALLDELTARVRTQPGIEAAGVADALPLDRNRVRGIRVPGQVYPKNQTPVAFLYVVGPGYI